MAKATKIQTKAKADEAPAKASADETTVQDAAPATPAPKATQAKSKPAKTTQGNRYRPTTPIKVGERIVKPDDTLELTIGEAKPLLDAGLIQATE